MHFKISGTDTIECLCNPNFSNTLGIPEILSTQFNSLDLKFSYDHSDLIFILLNLGFNFSSDRADPILRYIIFLMCHLSISLPRGQDDYIIELNFNSS